MHVYIDLLKTLQNLVLVPFGDIVATCINERQKENVRENCGDFLFSDF